MAVNIKPMAELLPVAGVRLATVAAGIKKNGSDDLVMMALAEGSTVAGTFTRNAFCAAPVTLCRKHLQQSPIRYLLINAGNANAGTGEQGVRDARQSCVWVGEWGGVPAEAVLPFSTGVIGQSLPMDKLKKGVNAAISKLDENGWSRAAHGIMTTDTVPKGVSKQIEVAGGVVTITGIAKGSGMIHPDMATMLAYVATDAKVPQSDLQTALQSAVELSFNSVSVDGDTSTNDSCILVATGQSAELNADAADWPLFQHAIDEVCRELAQLIIRDGEGATKLITLQINGGTDVDECRQVGFTIAHSPLVKTAFFASDANWGRILAAVGRSGLTELQVEKVSIYLDEVCIVSRGQPDADYSEEAGSRVMAQEEITVRVELERGEAQATLWSCDLSHDYVSINADYRS